MDTVCENIDVQISGNNALLTLNSPPANTWTADSLSGLRTLVEQLNDNREIYSLVITGAGEKFFCAGADLNIFADGDKKVASDIINLFGAAFEALADFRGVSIAAINGYAMGGGLECALACDIRVAETHAVMALPEVSVGVLPGAGGTQRLPWLVGEGWAKRMILCGERVDAVTAQRIGLVQEVVEKGESRDYALQLAEKVARQSPIAVSYSKHLIHRARNTAFDDALTEERERFAALFDTEDQREGVRAFLEKRAPDWKNA